MQVFSGKIEVGKESVTSTRLFLSNQITEVSEMTEKILSSSPKSIKICSVEGCLSKHFGKSFCHMHYMRWRKHGSPNIVMGNQRNGVTPEQRFWSRVKKDANEKGCWEWQGGLTKGYGTLHFKGRPRTAHQVGWFMQFGYFPKYLLHSCDNPPCCNPAHLSEGTHRANIADMIKKNRQAKGSRSHAAKLNEIKVLEIKQRIHLGEKVQNLAKEFQVGVRTLYNIKEGKTWKHVILI